MRTDMSFLLSVDTDDMEKLKKELLEIEIEDILEDLDSIVDDKGEKVFQNTETAINKLTDEEPMAGGFLTALGVAIISRLVIEVIKKTPQAIKALKKLIKRILEKSQEKSKGAEPPVLELFYRGLALRFTNPSDEHIDRVLKRLEPALGEG